MENIKHDDESIGCNLRLRDDLKYSNNFRVKWIIIFSLSLRRFVVIFNL
jgi:hypothetical protein